MNLKTGKNMFPEKLNFFDKRKITIQVIFCVVRLVFLEILHFVYALIDYNKICSY